MSKAGEINRKAEGVLRNLETQEGLWEAKINRVRELLKARRGSSYREEITQLREQIISIEEKLLGSPDTTFWRLEWVIPDEERKGE